MRLWSTASINSVLLAVVAIQGACAHSEPYEVAAIPTSDVPLAPTPPVQLTFDAGKDRFPALTPDDRTLWYSFQSLDRVDRDRCLASMPAGGGTRREFCLEDAANFSRRDGFDLPTPGPDGQLLYTRYASDIGAFLSDSGTLMLADTATPLTGRPLLRVPANIDGFGFTYIGRIRWVARDRIILVAEDMGVRRICAACTDKDTIYRGVALLDGRIGATGATFSVIAGTQHANDFAISAGGDSLYFSRTDEDPLEPPLRAHQLYALPITGGTPRVVFTGSVGDTIRSVARIGTRLAVASEGKLRTVDLATGSVIVLAAATTNGASDFGMVTASSDGCRLWSEFRRARGFAHTTDLFRLASGVPGCSP